MNRRAFFANLAGAVVAAPVAAKAAVALADKNGLGGVTFAAGPVTTAMRDDMLRTFHERQIKGVASEGEFKAARFERREADTKGDTW